MRKIAKLAAIFATFGLALALGMSSCESGNNNPVLISHSVKYSTERGKAPAAITVFSGAVLTKSQLPDLTADGYTFGGWYDGDKQAVAGKYAVTKDVTLVAKWTAVSPTPGPTPGTTLDLSTVTADTTVANGFTITGTLANNVKISIADGATVTLKNASINADGTWTSGDYAGLNCLGDATITLEAGTTNTVKGFNKTYPGIHVPSGKTLTINGSGALAASPNTTNVGTGGTGAGIGGGVGLSCGNIVIAGGTITASSASHSAAIGSGGNPDPAGTQTCGNITITGGTVTATCSASYGAGIGAGINGECGNISITGGTVTASGSQSAGGAGIGCGGTKSTVGTITIADTVTKVTAVKGLNAQSIGKGFDSGTCVCGTITIGGTVYAGGISASPYTYPPEPPTGGINGLFSVSATKKVYFSKGNLQATYNGSSWTWSFANHQYDAFGEAGANTLINGDGTVSANGSVDLFGWVGANSAFTGMAAFGISNNETNSAYGNTNGEALKNDWGTNAISNGGNVANYGWRTLTKDEWNYVVNTRAGADNKKGAATVSDVKGWILLPDAWTLPAGASFTAGHTSGFTTNSYTAEQWAVMESAGAVFLPVTGARHGSTVQYCTIYGYYWSATSASATAAYIAAFSASASACTDMGRGNCCSAVRLAKDSD